MIVRVFSEGQYEIDDDAIGRLHDLDHDCQTAVEADDAQRFHACYRTLLDHIRAEGTELADDDLRGSDLMLPPPDISLEEARSEMSEHGLIPD